MPIRSTVVFLVGVVLLGCSSITSPGAAVDVEWRTRSSEGMPNPYAASLSEARILIAGQVNPGRSNCRVEGASARLRGATLTLHLDLWRSNLPTLGSCGFEAHLGALPPGEYVVRVTYSFDDFRGEYEPSSIVVP